MKKEVKYICLLTVLCLALGGCQFLGGKKDVFRLDPPLNKIYHYSFTKTSETFNKYRAPETSDSFPQKNVDTFKLNFSLENIASPDSLITYRLTFNDFFKNRKPFKIVFKSMGSFQQFIPNPFALYDSIGSIIRGRSITVIVNHKGVVTSVTGLDELVKFISARSHESEAEVRRTIADYISINAIKDLINSFFSAVPGFKVKESDKWVRNVMLITKAPVKLSDLYIFQERNADTAYIIIQSLISAEQSEGGTVYMKGKGKGIAIINYLSGMPYLYETRSETETTTTLKQYEYVRKEHFLVKEIH